MTDRSVLHERARDLLLIVAFVTAVTTLVGLAGAFTHPQHADWILAVGALLGLATFSTAFLTVRAQQIATRAWLSTDEGHLNWSTESGALPHAEDTGEAKGAPDGHRRQFRVAFGVLRWAERSAVAAFALFLVFDGLVLAGSLNYQTTTTPVDGSGATGPATQGSPPVLPTSSASAIAVISPAPATSLIATGTPLMTPTSVTTEGPSPGPTPSRSAGQTASPCPTTLADGIYTVSCLLTLLIVEPEDRTGYQRSLFPLWIDEDHNGCNTRQEVLLRDATVRPTIGVKCSLIGGEWISPYDAKVFTSPGGLDIDHVVPLAEAWDSGASGSNWDRTRRMAYANDLAVPWALLAVSASSNRQKGDSDPAEWIPSKSDFLCQYLGDWLAVKARWGLTVDVLEKAAISSETQCADTQHEVVLAPSGTALP